MQTTIPLLNRRWTLLSLLIIVPFGFSTKFYSGPASGWVNDSLGGILYVVFWSLVLFLVAPRIGPWKNAAAIFIATCIIETLQLWHPAFLQTIRRYFVGRTILGTDFSWLDMVHYGIGAIMAAGWVGWLGRVEVYNGSRSSGTISSREGSK